MCAHLLNNADLCLSLDDSNDLVALTFTPASRECEVVFECSGLQLVQIVKHPADRSTFFVGEAHVEEYTSPADIERTVRDYWVYPEGELPHKLYRVRALPEAHVEIICTEFEWYRRPFTP